MSSAEIKAQIAELMAALADFEGQVAQVIANYNSISSKISSIYSDILYSGKDKKINQDTLTIKGICNINVCITSKISNIVDQIESAKGKVSSLVNADIEKLEADLRAALAREEIERQKKLHAKNNANVEQLY